MFYKKGIDITNDKQMFNFLKKHFEYYTMGVWNGYCSIANNVKLYRLNLSGDWSNVLSLLQSGEYENLSWMIRDWCREHPGYDVYFNGRSNGYLVLKDVDYNGPVFPDSIYYNDTYEEYKNYCRRHYGSVKANRGELITCTRLVQDFDKLCDELRAYCDELSKLSFEITAMERSVELFNEQYEDDLELLGYEKLVCDEEGKVDVSEITTFGCLFEAFWRVADRSDLGYKIKSDEDKKGFVYYARQ